MKYTTYAQSKHDLYTIKECGLGEVILSIRALSRFSKVETISDFLDRARIARELDLRVILEWDILMTENDFKDGAKTFLSIPEESYDIVRVQDTGTLEYILQNSSKQIQYILESGNHNLVGVQAWVSYIGKRLERIVLSIELNKESIQLYASKLNCDIELLVLGEILLFYTPRRLLSALLSEKKNIVSSQFLEAIGESEESPHKGFPIVENQHGSFMFHMKNLFLLDKFSELKKLNINYLRVDLRFEDDLSLMRKIVEGDSQEHFEQVKKMYNKDVIRGYFNINKSDILFKKLKNHRIQRSDEKYVGDVLETLKGQYMAIEIRSSRVISLGDELKFITPEGKEYIIKSHSMKDIELNDITQAIKGDVILINYMGKIWPKSQVYLC